jgi:hypothetical protein
MSASSSWPCRILTISGVNARRTGQLSDRNGEDHLRNSVGSTCCQIVLEPPVIGMRAFAIIPCARSWTSYRPIPRLPARSRPIPSSIWFAPGFGRTATGRALMFLTQARDPRLLARLQSEAGDALQEMAPWRAVGWRLPARIVLARISGKPDLLAVATSGVLSPWQIVAGAALIAGLFAFLLWITLRFFRGRRRLSSVIQT